jgi:hypothetical protein
MIQLWFENSHVYILLFKLQTNFTTFIHYCQTWNHGKA